MSLAMKNMLHGLEKRMEAEEPGLIEELELLIGQITDHLTRERVSGKRYFKMRSYVPSEEQQERERQLEAEEPAKYLISNDAVKEAYYQVKKSSQADYEAGSWNSEEGQEYGEFCRQLDRKYVKHLYEKLKGLIEYTEEKCGVLGFADLHVHTWRSDGKHAPDTVIRKLKEAGVTHIALTDHDTVNEDYQKQSEAYGVEIICGIELSATYEREEISRDIHVIGLWVNPEDSKLQKAIEINRQAEKDGRRREYVRAILEKLYQQGIDLTVKKEDLDLELLPGFGSEAAELRLDRAVRMLEEKIKITNGKGETESGRLGRKVICHQLKDQGYTQTVSEGFDVYVGQFGERRAYVRSSDYLKHVSLREAAEAIRHAGGIAVLAHPYFYELGEEEMEKLIAEFASYAEDAGGMEVEYGSYDQQQMDHLHELCRKYGLLPSTGSDFHDVEPLKYGRQEIFGNLRMRKLEIEYRMKKM